MPIVIARSTLLSLLAAGVLSTALAQVSSASSVTSTFLTSSTGTSTIAIGDTIQFEVNVTANSGQVLSAVFWSLSGDAGGVVDATVPSKGWPGVAHNVTGWEWNYIPGTGNVDFSVDSPIPPPDYTQILINQANPLPAPGLLGLGWFGQGQFATTGTGTPSLVGTVTIAANAPVSLRAVLSTFLASTVSLNSAQAKI